MQEENATFGNFLKRTDDLAVRLGLNVQDLPDKIGISRASLFSYRTGNRPLTAKAWAKLEAAEEAAGIVVKSGYPLSTLATKAKVEGLTIKDGLSNFEAVADSLAAEIAAMRCAADRAETLLQKLRDFFGSK